MALNDDERFTQNMQESITSVLLFCDDDNATLVHNAIDLEHFDPPFDNMVARALEYRAKFKRSPGKAHVDDVFVDILSDKEHKSYNAVFRFLQTSLNLIDNLDSAFVADHVNDFVKRRMLRLGTQKLANRYQQAGANMVEDGVDIMKSSIKEIQTFNNTRNLGYSLADSDALSFLDRDTFDYCKLGIPEFDEQNIYPARKELFLFLAARNRGKSMFLHYCGKQALMKGWPVAHYTLENSAEMTSQRYFQTLFNGVRSEGDYYYTDVFDDKGNIAIEKRKLKPDFIIDNKEKTRKFIASKQEDFLKLGNLRIRQFPTGRLSFEMLERDLDEMEIIHKFRPAMILLDYPQIMKLPRTQGRQDYTALAELTINLRGLAVERDLAMIVPQQGNRSAERSKNVRGDQGGGSIEMLSIADNALTYSQTNAEEEHGLARLFAQKVRNDRARFTVLITQHYPSAQFCMSSRYMDKALIAKVKEFTGANDEEAEELEAAE